MSHDCRETQEALQEVMDNPVMLAGVCLGEAQGAQGIKGPGFRVQAECTVVHKSWPPQAKSALREGSSQSQGLEVSRPCQVREQGL